MYRYIYTVLNYINDGNGSTTNFIDVSKVIPIFDPQLANTLLCSEGGLHQWHFYHLLTHACDAGARKWEQVMGTGKWLSIFASVWPFLVYLHNYFAHFMPYHLSFSWITWLAQQNVTIYIYIYIHIMHVALKTKKYRNAGPQNLAPSGFGVVWILGTRHFDGSVLSNRSSLCSSLFGMVKCILFNKMEWLEGFQHTSKPAIQKTSKVDSYKML